MSTGDGRKVTRNEIDQVKDLIETCILNYMKKKDIIGVLYQKHNIEPCFTRMVWQRLEEQNKKFFRNYYLRLALKDQITRFNEALEIQADMIKRLNARNEVEALPLSGLSNCANLGLQHASGYPSNTFLAQITNAEMMEQGMNIGTIGINNEFVDFGNISASVSSSNSMGSNSHQLQRTFTDDLLEYIASQPEGLFESYGVTVENQDGNI